MKGRGYESREDAVYDGDEDEDEGANVAGGVTEDEAGAATGVSS